MCSISLVWMAYNSRTSSHQYGRSIESTVKFQMKKQTTDTTLTLTDTISIPSSSSLERNDSIDKYCMKYNSSVLSIGVEEAKSVNSFFGGEWWSKMERIHTLCPLGDGVKCVIQDSNFETTDVVFRFTFWYNKKKFPLRYHDFQLVASHNTESEAVGM